jgi:hypothetical protein
VEEGLTTTPERRGVDLEAWTGRRLIGGADEGSPAGNFGS